VRTGAELLVCGGIERRVVKGLDVTTYPQHVVRYRAASCTR